jgi:UDP-glucose 4-epimerase
MGFGRKTVDLLAGMNKHRDILLKALNVPGLGSVLKQVMDRKGTVFTYIPVNKAIEVNGSVALPIAIAEHFIHEASHRVILSFCPCRRSMNCGEYDVSLGCIFLGEGAREIDTPAVGRSASIVEAIDHLNRAVAAGLVPVVGKVKFDAAYLGVKKHHRLMTICFCCSCCCLARGIHYAPRDVRDVMVKLEGVEVNVVGECVGCGACVEACIFQQRKIVEGKSVTGEECKGCGRCASVCPNDAIEVRVKNPEYISQCIDRISAFVDIKNDDPGEQRQS